MAKWGLVVVLLGQVCDAMAPVMAQFELAIARRNELNDKRVRALKEEKLDMVPLIESDISLMSDVIEVQRSGVMSALEFTLGSLKDQLNTQESLKKDLMTESVVLSERMRWFDFHTFTELERLAQDGEPLEIPEQVAEYMVAELRAICRRVLILPNMTLKQAGSEITEFFDAMVAKMPPVFVTRPVMDLVVDESKRSCFDACEQDLTTRIRKNVHRSQDITMDILEIERTIDRVVNV